MCGICVWCACRCNFLVATGGEVAIRSRNKLLLFTLDTRWK